MNLFFRRTVMILPVLFGISLLTFLISRVVPTDPARLIAGPRASAEGVAKVRHEYGLDLPLWQQYVHYMSGVLRLDFGRSFSSFRPVAKDITEYLPATVELTFFSLLFAVVGGIGLGTISAVWQGSLTDQISRMFAGIGTSIPAFWLALLAQHLLYQRLGWVPFGGRISDQSTIPITVTGLLTVDSLLAGQWVTFFDAIHHLLLPALVLGLEPLAFLLRITRTSMLEVMREQYITVARAKGLKERVVILRHALKNALLPIVTIVGLLIGYMLSGSVLVEMVFSWPGIGRYAARAIVSSDYNAVMGVTLTVAAIYLLINLVADLLYPRLDPRVRY